MERKYETYNAISASYLSKVEVCVKTGNWSDLNNEYKGAESGPTFIGNSVHDILAGELDRDKLIVLDKPKINSSGKQPDILKEIIDKNLDLEQGAFQLFRREYKNYKDIPDHIFEDFIAGENIVVESKIEKLMVKLIDEVTIFYNATKDYVEAMRKETDDIILNKIEFLKDPYKTYNKIMNAVDMIENDNKYQQLFPKGKAIKEHAIYWKHNGIQCKSKPDVYRWTHIKTMGQLSSKIEVFLGDYKMHSEDLVKSIKDRKYMRQLSFYKQAIIEDLTRQGEMNGFTTISFRYFIIGYNTTRNSMKVLEISERDIEAARKGFYVKPDFYEKWDGDKLNLAMSIEQEDKLINGLMAWSGDKKNPHYVYGWEELIAEERKKKGPPIPKR